MIELKSLLAFATPFIGFVVWLVRLESKVHYMGKAFEEHQKLTENEIKEIKKDSKEVISKLVKLEITLNRIDDKLKHFTTGGNNE